MWREESSKILLLYTLDTCEAILLTTARSSKLDLIQEKAMLTLSFITSPSCPVIWIFCLSLRYCIAYTVSTFPPSSVQAIPFTTPTPLQSSFFYRLPKYSSVFSWVMSSFTFLRATFLHIFDMFLYSPLTPNYLEYLITSLSPSSSN